MVGAARGQAPTRPGRHPQRRDPGAEPHRRRAREPNRAQDPDRDPLRSGRRASQGVRPSFDNIQPINRHLLTERLGALDPGTATRDLRRTQRTRRLLTRTARAVPNWTANAVWIGRRALAAVSGDLTAIIGHIWHLIGMLGGRGLRCRHRFVGRNGRSPRPWWRGASCAA